jgi:hypothetical protein
MELWKSINGHEHNYMVNTAGQIKSIAPSKKHPKGNAILKPKKSGQGYLAVSLYKDKKATTVSIHRTVALAFLGPVPPGMNVNHIDGNKKNNAFSNLEYTTYSENSNHAYQTGLLHLAPALQGESNGNASLSESQAIHAAIRIRFGDRACDIAKALNVSKWPIYDIKARRKWVHLFAAEGPLAGLN